MSRLDTRAGADEPEEGVDFVGDPDAFARPLQRLANAGPLHPRLGRRNSSLIGLAIPPVMLGCLAAAAWMLDSSWRDLSAWTPAVLFAVGWGATEVAARRCDADVKRGRATRWAYVADWLTLVAFGLCFALIALATIVARPPRWNGWIPMWLAGLTFGISVGRLCARRRQARARSAIAITATFD